MKAIYFCQWVNCAAEGAAGAAAGEPNAASPVGKLDTAAVNEQLCAEQRRTAPWFKCKLADLYMVPGLKLSLLFSKDLI